MRRGFIFSLIALVMLGVLVLFASTDVEPDQASRTAVPEVREMNAIIEDIESDIERGLYITGFRSLLAQIEYMITTGTFIDDVHDTFEEAMLNGTINNASMNALNGTYFAVWLEKTEAILGERGFGFDYAVLELNETHERYDAVHVSATITYNLTDSRGKRMYSRTVETGSNIDIEGLEDPVYFVKSLGRLSNTLNFTNETDLTTLVGWSENNSRYRASNKSPSFLMRLEGDFGPSPFGIESIVNGNRFLVQGVSTYDGKSSIDALYFSTIGHDERCMSGQPSWFRLDVERFDDYTGAVNVSC